MCFLTDLFQLWWTLTNHTNICLCHPPDRTWHKVNDSKVDYSGDLWNAQALLDFAGHRSTYYNVGLMSLAGHMPDCSLNWIGRSSAIQGWQRCQCCSSPTQRWPSQSRRPFSHGPMTLTNHAIANVWPICHSWVERLVHLVGWFCCLMAYQTLWVI